MRYSFGVTSDREMVRNVAQSAMRPHVVGVP